MIFFFLLSETFGIRTPREHFTKCKSITQCLCIPESIRLLQKKKKRKLSYKERKRWRNRSRSRFCVCVTVIMSCRQTYPGIVFKCISLYFLFNFYVTPAIGVRKEKKFYFSPAKWSQNDTGWLVSRLTDCMGMRGQHCLYG